MLLQDRVIHNYQAELDLYPYHSPAFPVDVDQMGATSADIPCVYQIQNLCEYAMEHLLGISVREILDNVKTSRS